MSDTICAIATPSGGALGIIRISGSQAITIASTLFKPAGGRSLNRCAARLLVYGNIVAPDGEIIDEAVASLYKAPHSYTGENSVEFSCHGSPYILQQVMHHLIDAGCRQAQPGEFTQRAFLAGKMDLSRAEAVADLIASTNAATHRLAMSQLRGGFGDRLRDLRSRLLKLVTLVELELDFSEEDVEFADRTQLTALAGEVACHITQLVDSFKIGNAVKRGIPVAIVGQPNTGKSTLLNTLLNEERALVSDISGTTRDTIEEVLNIGGLTFRLIDTAGLRDTGDTIERMGIQRTYHTLEQATLILYLVDCTAPHSELEQARDRYLTLAPQEGTLLLFNKSDLVDDKRRGDILSQFSSIDAPHLFISAKCQQGIDELQAALVRSAAIPPITQNDVIVTNVRHYEALKLALASITRVQEGLHLGLSGDLLSQDLRECIHHLSDILGEVTTDEVLQNIFKNFCIGK